nr:hypothetical protein [uncultured Halomonas sp.]
MPKKPTFTPPRLSLNELGLPPLSKIDVQHALRVLVGIGLNNATLIRVLPVNEAEIKKVRGFLDCYTNHRRRQPHAIMASDRISATQFLIGYYQLGGKAVFERINLNRMLQMLCTMKSLNAEIGGYQTLEANAAFILCEALKDGAIYFCRCTNCESMNVMLLDDNCNEPACTICGKKKMDHKNIICGDIC